MALNKLKVKKMINTPFSKQTRGKREMEKALDMLQYAV